MATTSPDNIWTPDSGDDYALTTDLAAMADTIQDALDDRAKVSVSGIYYTRNGGYTWAVNDTTIIWDNPVVTSGDFTYSNGVFTCVNAGVYGIQTHVTVGASTASGQIGAAIRDSGGVAYAHTFGARGQAHIQSLTTATLRQFSAGTQFSVTAISTGVATGSQGGGQGNWVMIWRVR